MEKNNHKNKTITLFIILIIFLSFLIRLTKVPNQSIFVNDQGRDLLVVEDMIKNTSLVFLGPATSIAGKYGNVYFGPHYYYFLTPFLLLTKDPRIISLMFPALFVIAMLLVLKMKSFSQKEKIVFILLISYSWISFIYFGFLWNLNLAVILSLIIFLFFLEKKETIIKSTGKLILFGFVAGGIFQMHYGMFFLYASLITFFNNKKQVFLYFTGLTLSFIPFILFDIKNNMVIGKNIVSLIFQNSTFSFSGNIYRQTAETLATSFNYYLFPGIMTIFEIKVGIMAIIFFLIILSLKKNLKTQNKINRFSLLSFVIFPLTFLIFKRDFEYYLVCFFPWFYFGLTIFLTSMWKSKAKIFILFFIIIFILVNIKSYIKSYNHGYGLLNQINSATAIANDNKSRNNISLIAFPNHDDSKGIEFILETKHNITIDPNSKKIYYICYFNKCNMTRQGKVIFEGTDIRVFTNNKFIK